MATMEESQQSGYPEFGRPGGNVLPWDYFWNLGQGNYRFLNDPARSAGSGTVPGAGSAPRLPPGWQGPLQSAGMGSSLLADILKKIGLPLALGLGGRALTGGFGSGSGTLPPEVQQLLALAIKRMTDQQPLADAINRQALAGLPTYAQRGP